MNTQEISNSKSDSYSIEKNMNQPEVRNTALPETYNIFTVTDLNDEIYELDNGSKWQSVSPNNNFCVGDKVQLIDRNTLKKLETTNFVQVTLLDLPPSERNVIQKIEWVFWAGEKQALVSLRDGSQWFFNEFASGIHSWKAGDRLLVFQLDESRKGNWRKDLYYVSNMDHDFGPAPESIPLFTSPAYARLATYGLDSVQHDYIIRDFLP